MKAITYSSTICLTLMLVACGSGPANQGTATNGGAAPETPPAVEEVDLPAGTIVAVRLDRALSTVRNRTGDTFAAILDESIVIDGREILPQGTKFVGHVTTSEPSGRLRGRGVLGITLDAFDLNGRRYPIATSLDRRTTEAHRKRNIEVIGGGAGIGALIGGLTSGGKGAGIGAAVGAAAGIGVAATTGKKDIEVPAETVFRFSLKGPVRILG
jgi:hypothetical protein